MFHEAVIKYKATANEQRIKMGQQIISEFIESGSEKQINLNFDTRKQILTLTNLVKRIKSNKEKYKELLLKENGNRHLRMNTTKTMSLKLLEIVEDSNENIQNVLTSMGFTETLFDRAYDEVLNLMANNWWLSFRNKILEYCGDEEFVKMQREKIKLKREEVKTDQSIIKIITSLQKQHHQHQHQQNKKEEIVLNVNEEKKRLSSFEDLPSMQDIWSKILNAMDTPHHEQEQSIESVLDSQQIVLTATSRASLQSYCLDKYNMFAHLLTT